MKDAGETIRGIHQSDSKAQWSEHLQISPGTLTAGAEPAVPFGEVLFFTLPSQRLLFGELKAATF